MTTTDVKRAGVMRELAAQGHARHLRTQRRIGLRELARVIGEGTDHGALSRWERGVASPTTANAVAWYQALSEITGQDLSELLA